MSSSKKIFFWKVYITATILTATNKTRIRTIVTRSQSDDNSSKTGLAMTAAVMLLTALPIPAHNFGTFIYREISIKPQVKNTEKNPVDK